MIWPLSWKRRRSKVEYTEVREEQISTDAGSIDILSQSHVDSDAVLKTVYRVSVRTTSNRIHAREYDSLEDANKAARALVKVRYEQRLSRFIEELHRQQQGQSAGRIACTRAAGWLDNLALVLPTRIVNEDLGDVLERIDRLALRGQSPFKIYLLTTSSMFWLIANAIGYFVRAVGARKSA